jgi:hypothetical protein
MNCLQIVSNFLGALYYDSSFLLKSIRKNGQRVF